MATIKLNKKYRCLEDCKQEGCPEHELSLEFQSVSNSYVFNNGNGNINYFDKNELETMLLLIKELSERRSDAIQLKNVNTVRELLIGYQLKMTNCSDKSAEMLVDSYLALKNI